MSKNIFIAAMLIFTASIVGCAGKEYRHGWGYVSPVFHNMENAVEKAREDGKGSECPVLFSEVEDMRNKAFNLYRQCNTAEAKKLALETTEMADKLCPAKPVKDSDGDGVPDNRDKCPGTPSGVKVDSSGCPLDSDGDGVYDYLDKCPGTPKGAPVNSAGCPLDSDGDGVYDYLDKCPGTPRGIQVDAKGCPVPIKEDVSIELKVKFAFNSDKVESVFKDHIQKVANFLKAYPSAMAEIDGHTDSIGSEKYNLDLSQRRAENVMKHLISKGIDPSRIKAVGFGESRPVADNSTKEGRQQNRRVVAVIKTTVTK